MKPPYIAWSLVWKGSHLQLLNCITDCDATKHAFLNCYYRIDQTKSNLFAFKQTTLGLFIQIKMPLMALAQSWNLGTDFSWKPETNSFCLL
jgi:hypothetical protein